MKCRFKISTDLFLNPLNIRDTFIPESNKSVDVICLVDNSFSYDKDGFKIALDKEEAKDDDWREYQFDSTLDNIRDHELHQKTLSIDESPEFQGPSDRISEKTPSNKESPDDVGEDSGKNGAEKTPSNKENLDIFLVSNDVAMGEDYDEEGGRMPKRKIFTIVGERSQM